MRTLKHVVRCCVVAVTLLTGAGVAGAHHLPFDWRQGHAVGDTCGLASGHYVKWVQAILWAENNLTGTGDGAVDGYFGPVTRWGVGTYQLEHGIAPADGCAGYQTFNHMMLAHRYYIGINGFYERYQYRAEKTVTLDFDPYWDCWRVLWFPNFNIVHGWGTGQPCTT